MFYEKKRNYSREVSKSRNFSVAAFFLYRQRGLFVILQPQHVR